MQDKQYTSIRKFYAVIGFTVFWSFVVFMIWSIINQNELVLLLNKIFG